MPPDQDTTLDTSTEGAADDTSIRSGLEAAFAENSPAAAPAPTAQAPAAAPAVSAPAPVAGTTTPAADPAAVDETPGAAPAPATERAIPERLKARFGEKWQALPLEIRDTFHEYESNIGRLAHRYGKDAKAWNDSQAVFAPYADMVRQEGGDFNGALSNLLETARILRQGSPEQKIVLLRQTAQMFGVPLEQLTGNVAVNEDAVHRLNQLERENLTNRAAQTHNAQQQVTSELETFTSDPANVYLQEPGYMETMAALIKGGKAEGLQDAYQKAAWLHERPRQLEIARQNQQRLEQSRSAAERARRAASSTNGSSTGNVRVDPSKLTLRDTLAAAFDGELE